MIEPTAGASPPWVQHVVRLGPGRLDHHPVPAGSAAVWIQVGLGVWLLAAPRGTLSRLAGLASVGWGLIVWVFGESFGGIFAPGLTWLTGAPGAVLIYVAAGALIALPARAWRSPRAGPADPGRAGALPGRDGGAAGPAEPRVLAGASRHGQPGPLAAMVQSMARTPQPGFLSAWVAAFGAFDEAHGFAVNLFVVAALAVTGAAFLSGRPWLIRPALIAFTVLGLADWVLVEDLGFLGGLGTDPNSMIPFILLASGGYLALTRPAPLGADVGAAAASAAAREAAAPAVLPAFFPERRWCAPRILLGGADSGTFRSFAPPRPGSWRAGQHNLLSLASNRLISYS